MDLVDLAFVCFTFGCIKVTLPGSDNILAYTSTGYRLTRPSLSTHIATTTFLGGIQVSGVGIVEVGAGNEPNKTVWLNISAAQASVEVCITD